ncbi:hypothetical protein C8J42_10952 [Sphingomonas sp. PP-CE-1A-559]|uniref:hypothetical protein n=1 Tax=Sphingomonas sp. PP-CE-1A-559 TaxID=2135657 RepID=UPI00105555E6|nr:hypothetical protein [Sphingomonas sp. PP-CE-1A-559]TCP87591.1 hypothetical protein C8J42_10952 [Sphingomonas sp. PP-CE-1A-559]
MTHSLTRRELAFAGGGVAMTGLAAAGLSGKTESETGTSAVRKPLLPHQSTGESFDSVSLRRYDGDFKDKSRAFHDAYEEMRERKISVLIVPTTTNSGADHWACQTPIWDRKNELPEGATIAGEGAVSGFAKVIGPQVVYEGDRSIIEMDYTAAKGRGYALPRNIRDVAFMWTELDAFGFVYGNDPRRYAASDSDSVSYIMHLRLTGTGSFGYVGSKKGPLNGDGVALAKAMGFYCGSGWFPGGPCRRTFWLRGCDDATIRMRRGGGGRFVMQEAANTFGSNLLVETNWVGFGNSDYQSEEEYAFWDSGNGSRFTFGHVELTSSGSAQKALIYVNGSQSRFLGGTLNGVQGNKGVPLFHVGPGAQDVIMDGTICLNDMSSQAPTYSPPANGYAFGDPGRNGRVLIRGANVHMRQLAAANPRVLCAEDWPDSVEAVRTPLRRWDAPSVITPRGLFSKGAVYTPRGIVPPQNGFATIFPEVVADTSVAEGFVWRLIAGKSNMVFSLAAGSTFGIGDHVRIFYRVRSRSTKGWNMVVKINDQLHATIGHANSAGEWRIEQLVIDTAAMKHGDTLGFWAMGQADADAFIEFLGWENQG